VFSTTVSTAILNILTTILNTRCTIQSLTLSQTLQTRSQLYCCMATDVTARSAIPSPSIKLDCTPSADDDGRSAVISSALKKKKSKFSDSQCGCSLYDGLLCSYTVYENMSSSKLGHPEAGGSTFLRNVEINLSYTT